MNDQLNFAEGKKNIPTSINVLTILTFIGSGILFLLSFVMKPLMKWSMSFMDKAIESGKEFSAKEMESMSKAKEAYALMESNWMVLLISSIICIALCVAGAIMMRKLKKDGYWLYLVGEIAPYIINFVIMGKTAYSNWTSYLGLLIPITFIILYTVNKKHLNK